MKQPRTVPDHKKEWQQRNPPSQVRHEPDAYDERQMINADDWVPKAG